MWGRIAAIGTAVGGSLIPGVGPALAIPAAAALWTGDSAADASKKAADTVVAGGDRAAASNERVYNDTRGVLDRNNAASQAAFAPFIGLGQGAVGSLGSLLNMPNLQGATPAAGVPAPQAPGASAAEMTAGRGGPGGTPQAAARAQTASSYRGMLGGAAGVVPLVAPTGETMTVPAAQAQYYIARGAKMLGSDQTGGGYNGQEVL